uniref:Filament-like plant protein 3 n=1 Tax=Zea mays TaxID=4577 RepID=A0A804MR76_MAIZE
MDRRSWLWRRKSTDKSPGETETSASEKITDEQDSAKSSPNSTRSPEITSKELEDDNDVKVKVLSERLSSVVLDVRAKDDLVKQHSKVAEEAVLGWEKAEKEISSLKAQLSAATAKNSALEDRLVHLDGALKECVRQLRRAKDEQDQTVQDALARQARQWESHKADLELRIVELTARLEAKSERSVVGATDGDTRSSRLAALEKENSALKLQLLAKTEELELRTIEKELNRRAAETASKQQLEGIRKVAKLQAECRRLQAAAQRRASSVNVESLTDCQSDCSDSWASALVTELDQFKKDKSGASTRTASLVAADIDVMDDFLEMEKLASANGSSKGDAVEDASGQVEKALHEAQRELRTCRRRVMVAEERSAELQRQLNHANGDKHAMEAEAEAAEAKGRELEGKLELARADIAGLLDKGRILEERLESEKALTLELAAKYQDMETLEAEKRELNAQLETSRSEAKKLSDKIALMERKLEVEKALSIRLATKCHGVDALEAKKKGVELELESAREEIASLRNKASSLELQVMEEKASSAGLAMRCQELEELRSQLVSSNSRIVELNEKVKTLEDVIEKQRPVTAELESQLQSRHDEISSLKEDISLLQKKLESQKNLSSAYISALGASETEKKELATRFELGEKEAEELRGKTSLLEEQIHEERARSSEFAVKCRKMEEQFSRRSLLGHQPVKSSAIKDIQIRKETELAKAAGKLADCQKTIASLSSQLKSLADFDEFLPETETSGADSADAWDGDLKLLHPASYPTQIGCLAVT